ncbi:MAG: aminotransferase class I/II-fold pyridoxal phosphate-dependent enzyme [Candidatus Hodarchaeota archaeon]
MNFAILKKTPLYKSFSELGKRIFLPEGIFYWSGRAKKEAEFIGTIGAAYAFEKDFIDDGSSEWLPCYLDDIKNYFKNLKIDELVPYASVSGLQELRMIWKDWLVKKSVEFKQKSLDYLSNYISMPIITSGITNAIFLSCALFLNPTEYIISPNKRWGNYDNIIKKFLGAKIYPFEFFVDKKFNILGLEEAILEISRIQEKIVIILGFPNNPTGYVPTWKEKEQLVASLKLLQKEINKPIVILIDDAYEPYIYSEDVINRSIFYDLQQVNEDIIPVKLDGITKELLMYGGRIGFITIGLKPSWVQNTEDLEQLKKELESKLSGLIRSTVSNCNHFYQAITLKLFKEKGIEKILESRKKVQGLLKERYRKLNIELNMIRNSDISIDPNAGGFFLFLNLNPNKIKATEFADQLLKKYKVGIIPIESKEENINGIRIAYCSIDITHIPEIVNRIKLALNDY